MTDTRTSEAWAAYEKAAAASRVSIRELGGIGDLRQAEAVLAGIWGPETPPLTAELMRALGKAESYVAGAYDGSEMVGVCVGFHSTPAARAMHSHIAGVVPAMAGRHAGFALKLHQRAWCLDHGIDLMEWTYDPLVARNAYFNLAKLGARVAEYLPDFYGPMTDRINREDQSDRILVHWRLASREVAAACAGEPVRATASPGDVWVEVPRDVEALRVADPVQARGWRTKVREQLVTALDAGEEIAGFAKDRGYLLTGRAAEATPGGGVGSTTREEGRP
ncbi:MAG: GNAT family N-acetyltransferase [Nocardioides sp.]|nr:GNAT family N-acetyltransferase [Nocardioides sp.]